MWRHGCQVLATHPYAGEDVDELSFEPGDVINVIPFEDPEDQVSAVHCSVSQIIIIHVHFWSAISSISGALQID